VLLPMQRLEQVLKIILMPGESQSMVLSANTSIELLHDSKGFFSARSGDNDYKLSCLAGDICLSIPSAVSKRAFAPFSEVFLRVGQSYCFSLREATSPAFISNFVPSEVTLARLFVQLLPSTQCYRLPNAIAYPMKPRRLLLWQRASDRRSQ
jgi:hypothetical protein